MRRACLVVFAGLAFAAWPLACSSDDDAAGEPVPGEDAGKDAGYDAPKSESGPDVEAGSEAEPDAAVDGAAEAEAAAPQYYDAGSYVPTPQDVQFKAIAPLPSGEQLLLGDWNTWPNALYSMPPEGGTATKIFEVYRIWSMGVSNAADKIAFSCGNPEQEKHYGLTLGDALQHTWIYDVATQQIELLTHGNINDECHRFGPGDKYLYLCRRWDHQFDGEWWINKGYSMGRVDLATKEFSLLSQDTDLVMTLHPEPSPDETSLMFTRITIEPPNSYTYEILKKPLPDGASELVRAEAGTAVLSPDGTRYAYSNYAEKGAIYVASLDGTVNTKVVGVRGTDFTWSPDGTRLAYLLSDSALNCSHVEVVKADGTEAPVRVRDCEQTQDYLAELAWIVRP